jgi:hypothetical protein
MKAVIYVTWKKALLRPSHKTIVTMSVGNENLLNGKEYSSV